MWYDFNLIIVMFCTSYLPWITSLTVIGHLMERIEKVQYPAALAITGAWTYEELGWETFSACGIGGLIKFIKFKTIGLVNT